MMKLDKSLSTSLVTLVLLFAATLDGQAQFGRPGGGRGSGGGSSPLELLQREDVSGEVGLTDEQKKSLAEAQSGLRDSPEMLDIRARADAATNDEVRRAIFGEIRGVVDKKVNGILKPEQRSRLGELVLQRQGMRAFADPELAGQFSVSDDQRAKIEELSQKYEDTRREVRSNRNLSDEERDAKSDALRVEFEKNASAVLSDEQRHTFEQIKGKPFAFAENQQSPFGPQRRDEGQIRQPAALAETIPTPSSAAVTTPATTFLEGESAVVSFGADAAGDGVLIKELSFNFRYAPWTDVLTLFSNAAGLTLDLNAVPPGTFNYRDSRKYTPTQALDVLNGYLIQKGYILVRRNEFLVVVNIDNGIPPNLVPTVTLEELPSRGRNELMSVLMPILGMTAEEAATEARELLGPQGKVVALNKANKLVVTDIGSNLLRIYGLLSGIELEDGDKIFRKFELKHISVLDAETVVRDLFALGQRGFENVSGSSSSRYDPRSRYGSSSSSSSSSSYSRDPRDPRYVPPAPADANATVTIAIDERTNSLLVTASPTDIKIIEEAIEALDLPPLDGQFSRSSREPYFKVYQLETADPMEVTKTLDVLFPGTVVNEDGRSRRIHIKATEEVHREIETTIRQLDGVGSGASQLAVIPLVRMDAYTATTSIQSLFYADEDGAPVVQPHPTSNALVVRGSPDQVSQIKLLVTQLEPVDGGGYGGTGNLRTIPLGGRNPQEFLQALEKIWNVQGRNPIRTVIPSAAGAIRERRVPSSDSPFQLTPDAAGSNSVPTTPEGSKPPVADPASKANQSASFRTFDGDLAFAFADDISHEDLFADEAGTDREPQESSTDSRDAALDDDQKQLFQDLAGAETVRDKAAPENGERAASNPDAPIAITIQGGNLVIASDDEEALDRLEEVISSLAQAMPPKTQWTVFYLRSADATQTAAILERLFPTSSVTTSLGDSDGGFMSELSGGLSSMGRGLMDMTGLNSMLSGPQTLRIIPDVRSNSLFVSGPTHQIDEVEDLQLRRFQMAQERLTEQTDHDQCDQHPLCSPRVSPDAERIAIHDCEYIRSRNNCSHCCWLCHENADYVPDVTRIVVAKSFRLLGEG
ncbi:MAG: hypothetical protein O3B86_00510, partial [Planctomycetota bacterium]|nr:hypothetical protein [Planctomycetota bacterium]